MASLGHAAIFLLGTETRQTVPIPIILRSGDVFIMSGLGRKRYHGEALQHSRPSEVGEEGGKSGSS